MTADWLTLSEVAEWLRFSQQHIYRMAQAGVLPGAVKIGGSWRFRKSKIEAWLQRKEK